MAKTIEVIPDTVKELNELYKRLERCYDLMDVLTGEIKEIRDKVIDIYEANIQTIDEEGI